ncbi:MAG: ABC transporter substrate-binding protein [Oscillospiraceae bacterium]|nr:ABC transporter substrate-binding protein [Oscillospiraceae bacterium]
MKNWKKLAALLLSGTMLAVTGGCAGGTTTSSTAEPAPQTDAPAETEAAADSEAVTEENATAAAESDSETITVTDHLGNTVEVPKQIDRIVVGNIYPLPSVLTIFFDSGEKIVGMADVSMKAAQNGLLGELYPEVLDAETGFIQGTEINVEEVVKLDPDVVFYGAEAPQIGEQLNEAGIPAVAVSASKWEYDTIETLNNWLDLLGEMFPENAKGDICRKYSEEKYNFVQERVKDIPEDERERAFFLFQYSEENITTSGKLFFGQWWADAIGCKNVGEELTTDNSTAVDMEQIYAWNPSLVFITNFNAAQPDTLYNNQVGTYDWSAVKAVEDKRIYKMPLGMYRSYTPGIDTPITLLWLAKTAYPEKFEDIDITEETKAYYKEVFGVDLTDEQANSIFAPVSAAAAF